MVLTDKEILELISSDIPLINPFDEGKLRGTSYDVALGSEINCIKTWSSVIDLSRQDELDMLYTPRDISEGFILKPGQYVLAQLKETISLPDDVIASIVPRTRFTRLGVLVADQFCNSSYSGRLSVGIYNASPNNILLTPDLAIAQLVFEKLESAPSEERLYRNQTGSAYHNERLFIGAKFDKSELSDTAKEIYNKMMAGLLGA